MDAHNTFQAPQAVKPAPFSAAASNGKLNLTIPAKSVVVVAVE
jgi:alpha-N-arabinofuranosidase